MGNAGALALCNERAKLVCTIQQQSFDAQFYLYVFANTLCTHLFVVHFAFLHGARADAFFARMITTRAMKETLEALVFVMVFFVYLTPQVALGAYRNIAPRTLDGAITTLPLTAIGARAADTIGAYVCMAAITLCAHVLASHLVICETLVAHPVPAPAHFAALDAARLVTVLASIHAV